MSEQWYIAECVYKSIHTGEEPAYEKLGEYRFFLLRATDVENARDRAFSIAKKREHSFQNQYGATVRWVLESVLNVQEIMEEHLNDGSEIYHRYFDPDA